MLPENCYQDLICDSPDRLPATLVSSSPEITACNTDRSWEKRQELPGTRCHCVCTSSHKDGDFVLTSTGRMLRLCRYVSDKNVLKDSSSEWGK